MSDLVQQMKSFYEGNINVCCQALTDAHYTVKAEHDRSVYLGEAWQCYQTRLALCLLQWRHIICNPRAELSKAQDVARTAVRLAKPQHLSYRGCNHFNFAIPSLIGVLLAGEFEKVTLKVIPPIPVDLLRLGIPIEGYLDGGLIYSLQHGKKPRYWDTTLEQLSRQRLFRLLTKSYDCYMQIALSGIRGELHQSLELTQLACQYYEERANDHYFADVPVSSTGGGFNNPHEVDFRLAAIMKCVFKKQPKILGPLQIVHLWRW